MQSNEITVSLYEQLQLRLLDQKLIVKDVSQSVPIQAEKPVTWPYPPPFG
jgi:hypothetical protein